MFSPEITVTKESAIILHQKVLILEHVKKENVMVQKISLLS